MLTRYSDNDRHAIGSLLEAEGYKDEELYRQYQTFVEKDGETIKGFFTLKIDNDIPHLQHFLVSPIYRGGVHAWKLWNKMREVVESWGYPAVVVHDTPETEKIIAAYMRCAPYAVEKGRRFYLMEVTNERNKN